MPFLVSTRIVARFSSGKRDAADTADKQRHAPTLLTFGGIHATEIGE